MQNTPLHPVLEWGRARFCGPDVPPERRLAELESVLTQVKLGKEQAALLAPTEVLAEQHFLTMRTLLHDSSVKIDLVTSRTRRRNVSGVSGFCRNAMFSSITPWRTIESSV